MSYPYDECPDMKEWQWRKVWKAAILIALVAALVWQCAYGAVTLTEGPFTLYRSGVAQPTTYATYTECRTELGARAEAEARTSGILTWACRQNVSARYSPCQPRADVSRETNCPAGTTGTWTQTHSWITAPAPECWTATAYVPTAPLPPACPPIVVADTQPPTAPASATATVVSSTEIRFDWGAATDNVGVTASAVEACAGVSCTSFLELWRGSGTRQYLHTVAAGSTWSYRARAGDFAGNWGAYSPIATATTLPVTPPPTSEWTHCANQGQLCAFTGTRRVRYGVGTTWAERELAAVNGGVMCDNIVFGNPASGLTKTCQLADTVTVPPPPTGTGTALLTWISPTENTDRTALTNLAGYRIHYGPSPTELSGVIDAMNAGLGSYTVERLPPGTWYFAVRAINAAGIVSDLSNVATKVVQ